MEVLKYVAHSKMVLKIAKIHGWKPAARYTNLRDIRDEIFEREGFLDIDWKNYSFDRHLDVTAEYRPNITIARDVDCIFQLEKTLREAEELDKHANYVAIVPKDQKLNGRISELIPPKFILGYSVPTRYGGTKVSIDSFDRPVHLLGGRPDKQRMLANRLDVFSLDCNRFTYDARFGDYFDGEIFRPHPDGGYETCIRDSIVNINELWQTYETSDTAKQLIYEIV